MRYAFVGYDERCLVCCPGQARDDDWSDRQEPDEKRDDND